MTVGRGRTTRSIPLDRHPAQGYGSRLRVTHFLNRIALLALVVTAGCESSVPKVLPPLDPATASFYFPTGMAVRTLPSGKSALLVVSSNFDLQYDQSTGGTLLAIDPDDAQTQNSLPVCGSNDPPSSNCCRSNCGNTLKLLGAARMGSFGGEVAYADSSNCPQLAELRPGARARVIAASRSENAAYWMTMDDQAQTDVLACAGNAGSACAIPLVSPSTLQQNAQLGDAYGVTIACSELGGTPGTVNGSTTRQASAFVTHQRAINDEGWVSEVPLVGSQDCSSTENNACLPDTPPRVPSGADSGDIRFQDLGATGDSYSSAYDAARGRLYVTSRFGSVGITPLRWLDFTVPLLPPLPPAPAVPTRQVGSFNLYAAIRGSLTRGLALSHDGTRGYMSVQIYDTTLATTTGSISVIASLLAILDLTPGPDGSPTFRVLGTVPVPAQPSVVKVLPPRSGKKDLVAVTCTDDGTLVLYDDEIGAVAASIGLDQTTGKPILGQQPFGLAVESQARTSGCHLTGSTCDRLYVGSFDRSWVNVVEVNPDNPSEGWSGCTAATSADCPALVKRIGRERP